MQRRAGASLSLLISMPPATPTSPPPTSRTHSSPQLHNPLHLRLYKVLAANFDDDATKDALGTLAELYAPPPASGLTAKASVKTKRDRSVGSVGDDDDEDGEEGEEPKTAGLGAVPVQPAVVEPIPGEIAARARRNLRRDVESKLSESSRRFLTAFAEVDKVRRKRHFSVTCTLM